MALDHPVLEAGYGKGSRCFEEELAVSFSSDSLAYFAILNIKRFTKALAAF